MHPPSGIIEPRPPAPQERGAAPRAVRAGRTAICAVLCAAAVLATGCHRNNLTSGYGVVWVTLTDSPGDFTSYIVNVDTLTLTRNDGGTVAALSTAEKVDLAKLGKVAELWGSATLQVGTYVSATLTLDYTNAVISVMVNGVPQLATVVNSANAAVTTQAITVVFDPDHPLVIAPTYATTAAQRLAIDVNLAASTPALNLAVNPATVTVKPYLTMGIAPPDNKLIRVRGPLSNSSVGLGTYTVYIRPFLDEANNVGSLTLFTDANTIFAINGKVTTGVAGITQLGQSSTGTTLTAAYAAYQPTPTPSATAGKFLPKYVVAGSTLEDNYTQGLEGYVIARTGNTLTVRSSTLQLNNDTSTYNQADASVLLGAATSVTADDSTATGLTYNSVAVGQHIVARGLCNQTCSGAVTLDATGSTTNTGSVRLLSTGLWGTLVAAGAGGLSLNLATIDDWPVGVFNFAGNGATAGDPLATMFSVNTGTLTLPDTTPGDALWIDGLVAPYGSAPPDFTASSVNDEISVQTAGAGAGGTACGQGNLDCIPASMRVSWNPGTTTPFGASLAASGASVDLTNASLASAVIRIGPEAIDLKVLGSSPLIIPVAVPAAVTATASAAGSQPEILPPVFLPAFSFGDPTAVAPKGVNVFSSFASFAAGLPTALAAAAALQLEMRGTYDRVNNVFYAISIAVVL